MIQPKIKKYSDIKNDKKQQDIYRDNIRFLADAETADVLRNFVMKLRGDFMFASKWDEIDDILTLRLVAELEKYGQIKKRK